MNHMFQRLPPSLNSSEWAPTVHRRDQTDNQTENVLPVQGKVDNQNIRLTIRISDETNAEVEETCVDTTKALLDLSEHSPNSDTEKQ